MLPYTGKLKGKNSYIEISKKNCFSHVSPSSQADIAQNQRRKSRTYGFSIWRGKSGMYLWGLAFCGLPQWLVSISADSKYWSNWHILVPRSHRVQKRELSGSLQCQWTCSITDRHQREQETSFWKRKRQSSLIGKRHIQNQRRHIPVKSLRGPQNL